MIIRQLGSTHTSSLAQEEAETFKIKQDVTRECGRTTIERWILVSVTLFLTLFITYILTTAVARFKLQKKKEEQEVSLLIGPRWFSLPEVGGGVKIPKSPRSSSCDSRLSITAVIPVTSQVRSAAQSHCRGWKHHVHGHTWEGLQPTRWNSQLIYELSRAQPALSGGSPPSLKVTSKPTSPPLTQHAAPTQR